MKSFYIAVAKTLSVVFIAYLAIVIAIRSETTYDEGTIVKRNMDDKAIEVELDKGARVIVTDFGSYGYEDMKYDAHVTLKLENKHYTLEDIAYAN